jgi:hypothetical protein
MIDRYIAVDEQVCATMQKCVLYCLLPVPAHPVLSITRAPRAPSRFSQPHAEIATLTGYADVRSRPASPPCRWCSPLRAEIDDAPSTPPLIVHDTESWLIGGHSSSTRATLTDDAHTFLLDHALHVGLALVGVMLVGNFAPPSSSNF